VAIKTEHILRALTEKDTKRYLEMMARTVESGASLKQMMSTMSSMPIWLRENMKLALRDQEDIIDAVCRWPCLGQCEQAMLRAGARVGQLPSAFQSVIESLNSREQLRHRLILALLYPSLLISSMALLLNLPIIFTQDFSAYAQRAFPVPCILVCGLVGLKWIEPMIPQSAGVRAWFNQLAFRTPGARQMMEAGSRYRLLFTLGHTLSAGLGLPEAVHLAMQGSGHPLGAAKTRQIDQMLGTGKTLQEVLSVCGLFSVETLQFIQNAEQTGTLDQMLPRLTQDADEYRRNVMQKIAWAVGAVALLIVVALIGYSLIRGVQAYFDQLNQIF
jgi:type II secretory pathway component PulF